MRTFTDICSRSSWRVIEADGHAESVTRYGAAFRAKAGWQVTANSQRLGSIANIGN